CRRGRAAPPGDLARRDHPGCHRHLRGRRLPHAGRRRHPCCARPRRSAVRRQRLRSVMRLPTVLLSLLLPAALLTACGRGDPAPAPATLANTTAVTATVGGATLQASSVAIANLDPA